MLINNAHCHCTKQLHLHLSVHRMAPNEHGDVTSCSAGFQTNKHTFRYGHKNNPIRMYEEYSETDEVQPPNTFTSLKRVRRVETARLSKKQPKHDQGTVRFDDNNIDKTKHDSIVSRDGTINNPIKITIDSDDDAKPAARKNTTKNWRFAPTISTEPDRDIPPPADLGLINTANKLVPVYPIPPTEHDQKRDRTSILSPCIEQNHPVRDSNRLAMTDGDNMMTKHQQNHSEDGWDTILERILDPSKYDEKLHKVSPHSAPEGTRVTHTSNDTNTSVNHDNNDKSKLNNIIVPEPNDDLQWKATISVRLGKKTVLSISKQDAIFCKKAIDGVRSDFKCLRLHTPRGRWLPICRINEIAIFDGSVAVPQEPSFYQLVRLETGHHISLNGEKKTVFSIRNVDPFANFLLVVWIKGFSNEHKYTSISTSVPIPLTSELIPLGALFKVIDFILAP